MSTLSATGCTALRHPGHDDLAIYEAVVRKLADAKDIDGMRLSPTLSRDGLRGCNLEDREFLQSLPRATPQLVESYCDSPDRAGSFAHDQWRALTRLVPAPNVAEPLSRAIEFSPVGRDPSSETALVFVRRQVALECDIGEYYLLRRGVGGWEVVDQYLRWIS